VDAGVKTWGDVFDHYKAKGMDQSDAAYRADQWEQRHMSEPTVEELLVAIIARLDKIEHRIATMEQNMHDRSIYFQGLVEGVRSAILSKLDQV